MIFVICVERTFSHDYVLFFLNISIKIIVARKKRGYTN